MSFAIYINNFQIVLKILFKNSKFTNLNHYKLIINSFLSKDKTKISLMNKTNNVTDLI